MRYVSRVMSAYRASIAWARRNSRGFNHAWLAYQRYGENFGPRLAAAIAYYGFFAAFALSLVAFSILGYVLAGNPAAAAAATGYLQQNLPFLSAESISKARATAAVLSLVGLLLTGVGWVDAMRSSQRLMWQLDQQPGQVLLRRLIDLAMLIGLGLLLALSLWISNGIGAVVPKPFGPALSALVNLVMAAALLVGVPRLSVAPRRMAAPVIVVGIGLTLLTTVGRVYVEHTAHNPAYRVVSAAAGLLVFLYLFSQLLLFGAALGATGRGHVRDLAVPRAPVTAPQAD
jgi:membrane protein